MNQEFVELNDIAALNRFFELSSNTPVVVFKHSSTCSISDRAYRELSRLIEPPVSTTPEPAGNPAQIGIVVVQKARAVSNEIEARTGIEHQSPQAFVFRDGKVTWTASHGALTANAVREALEAATD